MKTNDEVALLEWKCAHVLASFFRLLDESRYAELVGLFAENGVWHRQGKTLNSHDALMSAMIARPQTQLIRHVMGAPYVELQSDERASVHTSVTVFVGERGSNTQLPVLISRPFRVLDTTTSLGRELNGSWKILELMNHPIFDFSKAADEKTR